MKALWRNRSVPVSRHLGWVALAGVVVLGTFLLQLVPYFALPAPLLTIVGCIVVWSLSTRRTAPLSQTVELVPRPYGLEVRSAGASIFELRGKDLQGASLCDGDGGSVDVTLTHRDRAHRSFVFEGLAREDVEAFRHALALPYGGFGGAMFPQGPRPGVPGLGVAFASLLMAGCNAFLAATSVAVDMPTAFMVMATMCAVAYAAFLWMLLMLTGTPRHIAPYCALSASGLRYFAGTARDVAYSLIASARVAGENVAVHLRNGQVLLLPLGTLVPAERANFARQLTSAVERGQRADLPPTVDEALTRLEREPGEPLRAWLLRVDSLAVMPSGESTYRHMGVSEQELWDALEDPDTSEDVRIALARRLGRTSPSAYARVQAMTERLHGDDNRLRMRVAMATDLAQVPERAGDLLQLVYR
ncbi:MAG: hypothetical protein HOO96_17805 [Polyangiaceae bacterium]|nr:hypothetical protein [Polyangiaceae bacterium]